MHPYNGIGRVEGRASRSQQQGEQMMEQTELNQLKWDVQEHFEEVYGRPHHRHKHSKRLLPHPLEKAESSVRCKGRWYMRQAPFFWGTNSLLLASH